MLRLIQSVTDSAPLCKPDRPKGGEHVYYPTDSPFMKGHGWFDARSLAFVGGALSSGILTTHDCRLYFAIHLQNLRRIGARARARKRKWSAGDSPEVPEDPNLLLSDRRPDNWDKYNIDEGSSFSVEPDTFFFGSDERAKIMGGMAYTRSQNEIAIKKLERIGLVTVTSEKITFHPPPQRRPESIPHAGFTSSWGHGYSEYLYTDNESDRYQMADEPELPDVESILRALGQNKKGMRTTWNIVVPQPVMTWLAGPDTTRGAYLVMITILIRRMMSGPETQSRMRFTHSMLQRAFDISEATIRKWIGLYWSKGWLVDDPEDSRYHVKQVTKHGRPFLAFPDMMAFKVESKRFKSDDDAREDLRRMEREHEEKKRRLLYEQRSDYRPDDEQNFAALDVDFIPDALDQYLHDDADEEPSEGSDDQQQEITSGRPLENNFSLLHERSSFVPQDDQIITIDTMLEVYGSRRTADPPFYNRREGYENPRTRGYEMENRRGPSARSPARVGDLLNVVVRGVEYRATNSGRSHTDSAIEKAMRDLGRSEARAREICRQASLSEQEKREQRERKPDIVYETAESRQHLRLAFEAKEAGNREKASYHFRAAKAFAHEPTDAEILRDVFGVEPSGREGVSSRDKKTSGRT